MNENRNWVARFYNSKDVCIKKFNILDRTEHEAEKEALVDAPKKYSDWTLMPKDTDKA